MKLDNEVYKTLAPKYKLEDISNALSELEKTNLLGNKNESIQKPDTRDYPVRKLELIIAQDCNLRCKYCFAGTGSYKGKRNLMDIETAKKSIDFLIKKSKEKKQLEIGFFGGEPLLNIKLIKETISYSKKQLANSDKQIKFSITTNATLLNDEILEYLLNEEVNIQVSIDGNKISHDYNRPYPNNKGSFTDVISNSKKLLQGGKTNARGTISSQHLTEIKDNFDFLVSSGFNKVHFELALGKGKIFIQNQDQIEEVKKQYSLINDKMINALKNKQKYNFRPVLEAMKYLHQGTKKFYSCAAGKGYYAVGVNGNIYLCHRFVGNDEFYMGNVTNGELNNTYKDILRDDIFVDNRNKCKECWAKYICGGSCIAIAYDANKDIRIPDELDCEIRKHTAELAIIAYANLPKDILNQLFYRQHAKKPITS